MKIKNCSTSTETAQMLKIGDSVYQITSDGICRSVIKNIIFDTDGIAFDHTAIGENIFLTQADAEARLAEREARQELELQHRETLMKLMAGGGQ